MGINIRITNVSVSLICVDVPFIWSIEDRVISFKVTHFTFHIDNNSRNGVEILTTLTHYTIHWDQVLVWSTVGSNCHKPETKSLIKVRVRVWLIHLYNYLVVFHKKWVKDGILLTKILLYMLLVSKRKTFFYINLIEFNVINSCK